MSKAIANNSKYSPQLASRFARAIATGLSAKQVCSFLGISLDSYYTYCKLYPELPKKIEVAKEKYTQKQLKIIEKAGLRSWQASAWLLERTRPEDYSPKLNQTIDSNQPVVFNVDLQGTYKPTVATPQPVKTPQDTKHN